jgi:hypothetical protein
MELPCTAPNDDFNQQQYVSLSLTFNIFTLFQDANTSDLLLSNVFITMDWVFIYASQSTTSVVTDLHT